MPCGVGKQRRMRGCSGTGDLKCPGKEVDIRECNKGPCVPQWEWTPWEECTCTSLYKSRELVCTLMGKMVRDSECHELLKLGK